MLETHHLGLLRAPLPVDLENGDGFVADSYLYESAHSLTKSVYVKFKKGRAISTSLPAISTSLIPHAGVHLSTPHSN